MPLTNGRAGITLVWAALGLSAGCSDSRGNVFVSRTTDAAQISADVAPSTDTPGVDGAADASGDTAGPGPVLLYLFDEGSGATVHDRSGVAPSIDLVIEAPDAVTWLAAGLRLDRTTRVRQLEGNARKIAEPCARERALTIEAWVTPLLADQDGPARIVSLSQSSDALTFMLGQDNTRFTQRLRTTGTDLRGDPRLLTPTGLPRAGQRVHLVYVHVRGDEQLFVDGQVRASGQRPGDFSVWPSDHRVILGNEHPPDNRDFLGTLHRVAIWCRALSNDELHQLFDHPPIGR